MKIEIPLVKTQRRYINGRSEDTWSTVPHDGLLGLKLPSTMTRWIDEFILRGEYVSPYSQRNIIIQTDVPESKLGWIEIIFIGGGVDKDFLFSYGSSVAWLCQQGVYWTSEGLFAMLNTSPKGQPFYIKMEKAGA